MSKTVLSQDEVSALVSYLKKEIRSASHGTNWDAQQSLFLGVTALVNLHNLAKDNLYQIESEPIVLAPKSKNRG